MLGKIANMKPKSQVFLTISVFFVLFLFLIFNSFNYGITLDEHLYQTYGELLVKYFLSGFTDASYKEYYNLKYFGGFPNLIIGLIQYVLGGETSYTIRNACIASFSFVLIVALYKFVSLFNIRFLPYLVIPFVLFFPRLFGDFFNNSCDIPFAAVFAFACYYIARVFILRELSILNTLSLSFWVGATIATRFGGVILLLYIFVAYLLSIACFKEKPKAILAFWKKYWFHAPIFIFTTYAISFIFWPLFHDYPLTAIQVTSNYFVNYQANDVQLFMGQMLNYHNFPWFYTPFNALVTTPIFVLILFFAALPTAFVSKASRNQIALLTFAVFWFLFPIIFIVFKKSTDYDVVRHILFALAALPVIATITIYFLHKLTGKKLIICAIVVFYFCFMTYEYIKLNPLQYIYYNSLIGGIQGANGNYKLDYWGQSIKELVKTTANKLPKTRIYKFRIAFFAPSVAEEYFNEYMFRTSSDTEYDCFFSTYEPKLIEGLIKDNGTLEEFVSIKREGVILSQTLCKPGFLGIANKK